MAELWYRAALIQSQITAHSRLVLPGVVLCQAMKNYSRAWDYLLVALILLYALAWIWFPITMAIWTASSFITTEVYVWLRTPGRYRARSASSLARMSHLPIQPGRRLTHVDVRDQGHQFHRHSRHPRYQAEAFDTLPIERSDW